MRPALLLGLLLAACRDTGPDGAWWDPSPTAPFEAPEEDEGFDDDFDDDDFEDDDFDEPVSLWEGFSEWIDGELAYAAVWWIDVGDDGPRCLVGFEAALAPGPGGCDACARTTSVTLVEAVEIEEDADCGDVLDLGGTTLHLGDAGETLWWRDDGGSWEAVGYSEREGDTTDGEWFWEIEGPNPL